MIKPPSTTWRLACKRIDEIGIEGEITAHGGDQHSAIEKESPGED